MKAHIKETYGRRREHISKKLIVEDDSTYQKNVLEKMIAYIKGTYGRRWEHISKKLMVEYDSPYQKNLW